MTVAMLADKFATDQQRTSVRMPNLEEKLAELDRRFRDDGIAYLLIQFVDIHGSPKVKLVPASTLRSVAEVGAGFAGGAVWGMGQGPDSHDLQARADLESYTRLPFEPGIARFAADLYVDGRAPPVLSARQSETSPRSGHGNTAISSTSASSPSFSWWSKNPDGSIRGWDPHQVDDLAKPCYDYKGISGALGFLRALNDGLDSLGWGVYQADHEDANFQYEVNFRYADALTTADRLIFFRMMAGQLAQRSGAIATFMAKPFSNRTGSGAHMHYHLADASSGANLFLDESDPRGLGLSSLAYHFIGGVLEHAPALCAVTSPTVNCYKRLQMGPALTGSRSGYTWTPAFITYGDNNRTQMLRVPEGGHIEDRSISSASQPVSRALRPTWPPA